MMKSSEHGRYNWWKISFLLSIFFTSGCFITLFQLGVLQIRIPSKDIEHDERRHLARRSLEEDFETDENKGSDAFPFGLMNNEEEEEEDIEGEKTQYYNDNNNGDNDEDEDDEDSLVVDDGESNSGDDQESDESSADDHTSDDDDADVGGVDDEKERLKKKKAREEEKNKATEATSNDDKSEAVTEEGKTKVSDKKNVLSEDQLLKYHSKAVSKIWAPNIERNLVYLSSKSHLGGTKESAEFADWMSNQFKLAKLDNIQIAKYNVLCSYPTKPGKVVFEGKNGEKDRELVILEKKLDSFEKSTNNSVYPPYLAYSAPSNEEGEILYANYGSDEDFRTLKNMGLDCKDKILFIRYGKLARNKKIKLAEKCGAKGVILFSDPLVYSPTGVWYPDTWYLPPDGVMRGTLAQRRGDALTRGYPAIPGFYRRPISEVTFYPKIPVQPIGFGHAEEIFKQLDGRDIPNKEWSGGLNISYHVNSKSGNKAKLLINVTKEMREIQNVIGIIEGTYEPDRLVLVGNHRDAWGYGAADPSSGTAVLVEMARVLGELKKEGWKPRRTIMICSWDAEEFGLLGSTEWTEQYAKVLSQQAVAYVNVDTAVQGNHTIALRSTPELADVFFDTAHKFKDPDASENLYDTWLRKHRKDVNDKRKEPKVTIFREGSDYMPFYGDLGIPSLDFRYMFDTDALGVYNIPVYHTMHDNINWMRKFVDPDFRYHAAITQILTRVILLLADSTLLPFNLIRYSDSMWARVKRMRRLIDKHDVGEECDISLLTDLVAKLQKVTRQFHRNVQLLDKEDRLDDITTIASNYKRWIDCVGLVRPLPAPPGFITDYNELAVRQINDQMLLFERSFVANEDLVDDDKTRHVYHTSGLRRATFAVVRAKKKKNKKQIDIAVRDFKSKYSIYTYHAMMAIQALEHPFLTKEKP